jgi:hypothetical protein
MSAPDVPSVAAAQPQLLGILAQLEAFLDDVMIKKAPFQIPKNIKERIATVAPYLVIIGIALLTLSTILGLFGLLGMGAAFGKLVMTGPALGYGRIVAFVTGAAGLVLEAMALPGFFKRTTGSWRLLFYATVVSLAGSLLSFHVAPVVIAVVWAVIEWYLLFQVKELYRN